MYQEKFKDSAQGRTGVSPVTSNRFAFVGRHLWAFFKTNLLCPTNATVRKDKEPR